MIRTVGARIGGIGASSSKDDPIDGSAGMQTRR